MRESIEESEKILSEKLLTLRKLDHQECGKDPLGDLIAKTLTINRYYGYNTGIKNLMSNSYLDFYTLRITSLVKSTYRCVFYIKDSVAEQGTSQSLA